MYWWLTREFSHRCTSQLPLKITNSNVHSPYDLIISSIINFDHFSKPENGLKRKSLANRFIWILLMWSDQIPAKWRITSIIPTAWTAHFQVLSLHSWKQVKSQYSQGTINPEQTFKSVINLAFGDTAIENLEEHRNDFSVFHQKESMQEGSRDCPRRGWDEVFALWRMWKRPYSEREWILRDWQRGGVAGSKGAWTQMPSCRPWSEDKTSLKEQGNSTVWDLRNDCHHITILGKILSGQVSLEELEAIASLHE